MGEIKSEVVIENKEAVTVGVLKRGVAKFSTVVIAKMDCVMTVVPGKEVKETGTDTLVAGLTIQIQR